MSLRSPRPREPRGRHHTSLGASLVFTLAVTLASLASLVALVSLTARPALAHALDPCVLDVREAGGGAALAVVLTLTVPAPTTLASPDARFTLPEGCVEEGTTRHVYPEATLLEVRATCARSLAGRALELPKLAGPGAPVLVRLAHEGGPPTVRLTHPRERRLELPARASREARGLAGYLRLGLEHVVFGWDHLALLVCLALSARKLGGAHGLIARVTAFTLAHGVVLAAALAGLAALEGVARARLVEALVAASITVLAAAELRARRRVGLVGPTSARGGAVRLAFALGLLHGAAFASALEAWGTPRRELAAALVGLNLGVELAQAALAAAVFWLARRLDWPRAERAVLVAAGAAGACLVVLRL